MSTYTHLTKYKKYFKRLKNIIDSVCKISWTHLSSLGNYIIQKPHRVHTKVKILNIFMRSIDIPCDIVIWYEVHSSLSEQNCTLMLDESVQRRTLIVSTTCTLVA